MRYLVRAAVNALGLWLCVLFVPGIGLHGLGTNSDIALYLLAAGAILGVVNFLVRPILVILSIPLYILTLGLFFLVVNAAMLKLTAALTAEFDIGIDVKTWIAAILGGILLSIFNTFTDSILPEEYRRR